MVFGDILTSYLYSPEQRNEEMTPQSRADLTWSSQNTNSGEERAVYLKLMLGHSEERIYRGQVELYAHASRGITVGAAAV